MCIKINKVVKMYYCIGDYRFVYIKMKMDLIYLNVIFKYNVCKRFFKKIYFYFWIGFKIVGEKILVW